MENFWETEEYKKFVRKEQIKQRLDELTKDFIQKMLGADFGTRIDDNGKVIDILQEKEAEFISLHNELRELEGKEPREYK